MTPILYVNCTVYTVQGGFIIGFTYTASIQTARKIYIYRQKKIFTYTDSLKDVYTQKPRKIYITTYIYIYRQKKIFT